MPNVTVDPIAGTCDPDILHIKQNLGRGVQIQFLIAPGAAANWSWSVNPPPIVMEAPGGVFSGGNNPGGNGKGPVQVTDRNGPGDLGTFKYTARLIKDGTGEQKVIDPEVVNEN